MNKIKEQDLKFGLTMEQKAQPRLELKFGIQLILKIKFMVLNIKEEELILEIIQH